MRQNTIRVTRMLFTLAALGAWVVAGCGSSSSNNNCSSGSSSGSSGTGLGGLGLMSSGGSCSGGMPSDCAPSTDDTACGSAIKKNCCSQLTACNADSVCTNCFNNGCSNADTVTEQARTCLCAQQVCVQALTQAGDTTCN